uniref:ATP synthase subunit b n=1 Tax=Globodera rostochiensis TaxID=31243 RepID=A0A914GWM1_GLORO
MLSKQFVLAKCNYARIVCFYGSRQALQVHTQSAVEKAKGAKPEELDNPNIFQKIVLRFKEANRTDRLQSLTTSEKFPERDLVNFPYPEKAEYPPKTRFAAIPDSWCREIEKVTGTSGPYLFFGGLLAFLLNKEIIIMEENFYCLVFGWVVLYLFFHTAFRYKIEKYAYKGTREMIGKKKAYIDNELKEAVEFRKTSKEQADSLKAVHENFPVIFQENLALQLEATYRKNVDYAWQELKRRMDYLQEVQATKERFTKEMLVKLITEGVRKQIESNEGGIRDKYLDECIDQLRILAPK